MYTPRSSMSGGQKSRRQKERSRGTGSFHDPRRIWFSIQSNIKVKGEMCFFHPGAIILTISQVFKCETIRHIHFKNSVKPLKIYRQNMKNLNEWKSNHSKELNILGQKGNLTDALRCVCKWERVRRCLSFKLQCKNHNWVWLILVFKVKVLKLYYLITLVY